MAARVAGIHSPVPAAAASVRFFHRCCHGAVVFHVERPNSTLRASESNGCPTNLAPHWASSTMYHERITWDKINHRNANYEEGVDTWKISL
jgi:hypothetical protein